MFFGFFVAANLPANLSPSLQARNYDFVTCEKGLRLQRHGSFQRQWHWMSMWQTKTLTFLGVPKEKRLENLGKLGTASKNWKKLVGLSWGWLAISLIGVVLRVVSYFSFVSQQNSQIHDDLIIFFWKRAEWNDYYLNVKNQRGWTKKNIERCIL